MEHVTAWQLLGRRHALHADGTLLRPLDICHPGPGGTLGLLLLLLLMQRQLRVREGVLQAVSRLAVGEVGPDALRDGEQDRADVEEQDSVNHLSEEDI